MSKHEPVSTVASPTVNVVNILRVADAIERHEVPGLGFNMRAIVGRGDDFSGQGCGTVACIVGWCAAIENGLIPIDTEYDRHSAMKFLGIESWNVSGDLFIPPLFADKPELYLASDAVRTLRHLAATGEVKWNLPEA